MGESFFSHDFQSENYVPPLYIHAVVQTAWQKDEGFSRATRSDLSLSFICRGKARWSQDERSGTVEAGSIFLSLPEHKMNFQVDSPCLSKRSVIIQGSLLPTLIMEFGLQKTDVIKMKNPAKAKKMFQRAAGIFTLTGSNLALELGNLAWEIINYCAFCQKYQYPDNLKCSLAYMRQNIDKKLNLEMIAKAAFLSPRQCSRLFQQHFALSPVNLFIKMKMRRARSMLLNSRLSSKEIAFRLGYDDPLYFSKQFKKEFSLSPREMRKSQI